MALPADFRFSQSSLQDYLDCNYRFKLRYLLRQAWPAVVAEPLDTYERQLRDGQAFHQLVHRHLAGMPAEMLASVATEDPLQRWWSDYLRTGLKDLPQTRYPETTLAARIAGWWFVAKYDVIAVVPGERAVIVDWKTAGHPRRSRLAQTMQTIIYRSLLVNAGAHLNGGVPFQPEQVEMLYWFTQEPDEPERLTYNRAQYQLDGEALAALVRAIVSAQPDDFPRTDDTSRCRFCTYRSLCDRGTRAGDLGSTDDIPDVESDAGWKLESDFDQIAEIEF